MKGWTIPTLAAATVLFLASCAAQIRPPAPDLPRASLGEPPPSTVPMQLTVPVKPLLDAVEKDVPTSLSAREFVEFFGTAGPKPPSCGIGCGYDVGRSALAFASSPNEITTSVPLSYWLSCNKRIACKGRLVSGSCGKDEPRRRISESFSTRIDLLPSWDVSATTRNTGIVAADQCSLGRLGAMDVTDKLVAGFGGVGSALDKQLNQGLSQVRSKAEAGWRVLANPIEVDAQTRLEIRPEKVSISSMQTSTSSLQLTAAVAARPRVEGATQAQAAGSPLPNAGSDAASGPRFAIYLPVKMDYAAVEAQLKDRLKLKSDGVHYPTRKHYVRLTDVSLEAAGQKALFKLSFTGIAEGYLFLIGTPVFDAEGKSLSFPDLDYSPESKQALVESLEGLNRDAVLQDLRARLVIDLIDYPDSAQAKLLEALNRRYGNVQLTGSLSAPTFVALFSDPKSGQFVTHLALDGALTATVQ